MIHLKLRLKTHLKAPFCALLDLLKLSAFKKVAEASVKLLSFRKVVPQHDHV
jgi:hypothetical protein